MMKMDCAIYIAKHGILYMYMMRKRPREYGGESQREEQGQEETQRRTGDEKGSKLPDVKFFATNQRGDN